ncbi:hypothetical protein SpCBS45565_g03217 [Spizellomyces sp. 'palustris']|nr:hypothetical protein SpCBS45565_g03217 [Spizellomyces sp. 'palustris']
MAASPARLFLQQKLDTIRPTLVSPAIHAGVRPSSSGTSTPRSQNRPPQNPLQATEELLISLFIALTAGQRAMLVSTKQEFLRDLRKALDQLFAFIFNFTLTHVQIDRTTTHSDFLAALFYRRVADGTAGAGSDTSVSSTSRRRGLAQLSRAESEEDKDFLKSSRSSTHARQTSMKSDSASELESPAYSLFAPSYRSQRMHSHSRNAATAGSRPLLYPFSATGGETHLGSNTSLVTTKQLPNIVLVDGLHLASGAVHGALLEVLERGQVTDKFTVFPCPVPFLVVGLICPSSRKQTIPPQLPSLRITVGQVFSLSYALFSYMSLHHPISPTVALSENGEQLTLEAPRIYMHADVSYYLRDLLTGLRNHQLVSTGVSAKGGIDLAHAARTLAVLSGHLIVSPDHVTMMADKVIAHRLLLAHQSPYVTPEIRLRLKGLSGVDVVGKVINSMTIPM